MQLAGGTQKEEKRWKKGEKQPLAVGRPRERKSGSTFRQTAFSYEAYRSITCFVFQTSIEIEEFETFGAVGLDEEISQPFPTAEDLFERIVAEADVAVVGDRTAVVDLIEIRPHARHEAHMAGLASGIEFAAFEVERAERFAGVSDRLHFPVAGGVFQPDHLVVTPSYDLPVLYDDAAEGTAVPCENARFCFFDRFVHVFVHSDLPIPVERGRSDGPSGVIYQS